MKRPLLLTAAAWLLGELSAENMKSRIASIIIYVILVGITAARRESEKKSGRKPVGLIWLGVLLLLWFSGKYRMTGVNSQYRGCMDLPDGQEVCAEGRVKKMVKTEYGYAVFLERTQLSAGDKTMPDLQVKVLFTENPGFKVGNIIRTEGKKAEFRESRNEGNYDEKEYLHADGIALKIQAEHYEIMDCGYNEIREYLTGLTARLCDNIMTVCTKREGSVIKAVVYGDKADLDEEEKELYVKNGIAHILTVSGLHMSVAGMGLYHVLRKRFSFLTSGVVSGILIWFFWIMTGGGISVTRAFLMMLLRMIADVAGRTYDLKNALGFSVLFILMENPYAVFGASFLMSYSAMLSVLFCTELKKAIQTKRKSIRFLFSVAQGFFFWLLNLPVTAYFYYEVPVYAVLLNFVVIPLLSILFLAGMAASILTGLSVYAGRFAAGTAVFIVRIYHALCSLTGKLPGQSIVTGQLPGSRMLLFYGIVVICLLVFLHRKRRKKAGVLFLILCSLCLLLLVFYPQRYQGIQISMADVGQGDCTLVQNSNGHNYLIDAGSTSVKQVAEYRILPFLKCQGVGRIDAVFLSHGDADHINGVEEMLQSNDINIKTIYLPDCDGYEDAWKNLLELAEERNIAVRRLGSDTRYQDGDLTFEIISPQKKSYDDINDASMVMHMAYFEFSMYFTGDISRDTERELADRIEKTDVLKVAHHGSKTASSEEFLKKAQTGLALISCGENNRYGHPHEETLHRLQGAGNSCFITAETGRIRICVPEEEKGRLYTISTFIGGKTDEKY